MASLYSVIPGLVPTSQEILEAELLAKQVLEGKFPDLDLREGTGLRDLVLRPTAYAFALLKKANDYYFTQNTLQGINDSTPEETVDDILSNWFLQRNTGTYAVISARLYFARQKNVTITTDISFSPNNSLQYFPETSTVFPSSALAYDSYSNEWYLDVFLKAASTGSVYNLGEGSLLYFTNFDPYFLRAEINYLAEESTASETNSQFINRAASAISTRNLVNIPSTDSRLREVFNYIDKVVTVGAGDPDMIRDMIRIAFDEVTSFPVTSVSISGDDVTFSIGSALFIPGQEVVLSGASPAIFNGQYEIIDTGVGSITVTIPGNPGFVSIVPSITRSVKPLFVHNGGMADIYCGHRLSSTITQLTTDSDGIARIEGAVYRATRSEVSGGDQDDTIPLYKSAASYYPIIDQLASTVQVTAPGHDFLVTDSVSVLGIDQSAFLYSLTCDGLTVTARIGESRVGWFNIIFPAESVWDSMSIGSRIRVSGVSPTQYNGDFTISGIGSNYIQYSVPANIPIASINNGTPDLRVINRDLVTGSAISHLSNDSITVHLPNAWIGGVNPTIYSSGAVEMRSAVPMTLRSPYVKSQGPYFTSVEAGTVTVYAYNHGVSVGRRVTVKNCPILAANGSWKVITSADGDSFQFHVPALSDSNYVTTSCSFDYVDQRNDNGFSTRQVLEADFGQTYANKTVSFELGMFGDMASVQSYLDSPSNRILCGDYLARGFNLHILDVSVTSYNGTYPSAAVIQTALASYLASLEPGTTLVISEFVRVLAEAGVTAIKTPVDVSYTRYTRDLTISESDVVTDYLDPMDKTNIFVLGNITSNAENV